MRRRKGFDWQTSLLFLGVGGLMIGAWMFSLISVAVATFTRGSVILYKPSDAALIGATFLMLLGVVLVSIQTARILEYLISRNKEGGVQ